MGLQHNPHIFFTHLSTVVERIEGIGKGLLAFGTQVALATFTRQAMFMRFVMTTQRTLHYTTEQLHFVQSSSPTLLPCTTETLVGFHLVAFAVLMLRRFADLAVQSA